jgi:hypothetical protein
MKYYEDLLAAGSGPSLYAFVSNAIDDYRASLLFSEAVTAYDYFKRRNTTILAYKKLLYTMSGEAVPDNFSANYKFCNAFFPIFVKQENSYLLGDGVTFNDDATKDALGGDDFDTELYTAGEYALWGGVSYMFYNLDHVDVFKATEFVPLFGEEDGALHAGRRKRAGKKWVPAGAPGSKGSCTGGQGFRDPVLGATLLKSPGQFRSSAGPPSLL